MPDDCALTHLTPWNWVVGLRTAVSTGPLDPDVVSSLPHQTASRGSMSKTSIRSIPSQEDAAVPAPSFITELLAAVRSLRRAPLVFGSAIVCIGLGIGSTAAISSAISRALLQPLPFRDPERLVTVYRTTPHFDTGPFSPPNYSDIARETRQLDGLAAITPTTALLQLTDDAAQVSVKRVTGNLFPLLGVRALRGRMLTADDDRADGPQVVVIGEELWRERFGGDGSLVGKTIRLDGQAHTVV